MAERGEETDAKSPATIGDVARAVRRLADDWDRANAAEQFPADRMTELAAAGALDRFALLDRPGAVAALRDSLRAVGGADLSLGRIFEGHVNAVQLIARYGTAEQASNAVRGAAAGRVLGVWNTDADDPVGITPAGDGRWRLAGAKRFATGAGHIDGAIVTARDPAGARRMLLVDVGACRDRADNGGWRVRGMKGTCSGTFDFAGIEIDDDALIGAPGDYEREPTFSAGAWRFAAVQIGGAESLLKHWRSHLLATGKGDDAVQRLRFGTCVAAVRSAGLWVARAADAAEAGQADVVPLVLMTRGIVEDAALSVMEAAARAVGTAAFFDGSRIDRITRDLGLYLRQPVPDQARDRAAAAWLERDCWSDDRWW